MRETIFVLDFGSQYTMLIARRIRELGVYSQIVPFSVPIKKILKEKPIALILSGGPQSVYQKKAPLADKEILTLGIPVLGICYGMQWMVHSLKGKVFEADRREYGKAYINIEKDSPLFYGLAHREKVWMSHGDLIGRVPSSFSVIASTDNTPVAAIHDTMKNLYGIQFHPEVTHTSKGKSILKNFLFRICNARGEWNMESFIENAVENIRSKTKNEMVICGLSGGVDSSVMALLIRKAIGQRMVPLFIDTGLLRKNEAEIVMTRFRERFGIRVHLCRTARDFFTALKGITSPEAKRKAIGKTFIKVFEREAKKFGSIKYLAQGTIYPDRIESKSQAGPSATIKSHHNVGGLPKKMKMCVIEPLSDLFKDEVRLLGRVLGLGEEFIERHPFPGPGLGVRILGEITPKRVSILRKADAVFMEEIKKNNLYGKISQAFAVLLPVKTVGVMGDKRTYSDVIALRAVKTDDFMTADFYPFSPSFLGKAADRIINEVKGVNRVTYDVTSKPPATIEWE